MKTNEVLSRIYSLYASIGAWASQGRPGIWPNAASAKIGAADYVGPGVLDWVIESYHIRNPADVDFVRSDEALHALCLVIEAIYNRQPLKAGFFRRNHDG